MYTMARSEAGGKAGAWNFWEFFLLGLISANLERLSGLPYAVLFHYHIFDIV